MSLGSLLFPETGEIDNKIILKTLLARSLIGIITIAGGLGFISAQKNDDYWLKEYQNQ
jgi:hypothetical protein